MVDIDRVLSEIREAILYGLNLPCHRCAGCESKKPVIPTSLTYDTVGVSSPGWRVNGWFYDHDCKGWVSVRVNGGEDAEYCPACARKRGVA